MISASGSTTISTHTSTTDEPPVFIAAVKGWSGGYPNILQHNNGLWADLLGNKIKREKQGCIKLKFLLPFQKKHTRFVECPNHAIMETLLNFEFEAQSDYLLQKNSNMGLGPEAFLPRSKTSLAAINQQLDSMAEASVVTTTDISKIHADEPIIVHGQDATVALYDLMACFYHHLFGPNCPFVMTLLYTKQVVEEQAEYYATTEHFDLNLGNQVTSKLISWVQEFFRNIMTEEQLHYGMLPGTSRFDNYLQFMGMGIGQTPLPLAPPAHHLNLHNIRLDNQ